MSKDNHREDESTDNDQTSSNAGAPLSRRGLIGAGAATMGLGALASGASAQSGSENAPFAAEDHDHAGDYLGESDPVSRIDVEDLYPETINNRIEVTTDDDLAATIDDLESGDVVVLGPGEHTVSETIEPDVNNVTLRGQGMSHTTITVENGPAFRFHGAESREGGAAGDRHRWWTLSDLSIGIGDGDRLLDAKYSDGHRFIRVKFGGWGLSEKIYAHECWDWRFDDCRFGASGDGSEGSAAVYAYNGDNDNTNNFFFVNCWWEPIVGHALYSDMSGDGGRNGRFYLFNCKFHGSPDFTGRTSDQYFFDGSWGTLKINNCHFVHGERGHVRQRAGAGNTIQLVNNNFRGYNEACLRLNAKENYVANNSFWSNHSAPAIVLEPEAHETTIVSNMTGGFDPSIHVRAPRTTLTGNVVDFDDFIDDAEHAGITGITVEARRCSVGDNVVNGAGEHGIHVAADDVSVSGNTVTDSAMDGVHVADAEGVSVGDNAIRGAGGTGINATGSADAVAATGNTVLDSGGISLAGKDSNRAGNVTR